MTESTLHSERTPTPGSILDAEAYKCAQQFVDTATALAAVATEGLEEAAYATVQRELHLVRDGAVAVASAAAHALNQPDNAALLRELRRACELQQEQIKAMKALDAAMAAVDLKEPEA